MPSQPTAWQQFPQNKKLIYTHNIGARGWALMFLTL